MFDHFTFLAPWYERLIPPADGEKMRHHLQPSPGLTLLDAGGGTGRVAQSLREDFARIVVADISSGMLRQAHRKGFDCVRTMTESLPFDAVFDRVLMVDAFHHVAAQRQTARELFRVLKPGGLLVIQEPDIRRLVVKMIAITEKLALMRSHFLSAEQIAAFYADLPAEVTIQRDDFEAWVSVRRLS